ncbi:MAG: hypothetical protein LAT61_13585 [Alcanivorax sp.]|nr:hypothetical protein [Alcanivorax sp.]
MIPLPDKAAPEHPQSESALPGPGSLPWVCLGYLLITLVVLLTWQRSQETLEDGLHDAYVESGLLDMELPVYTSWLRLQGNIQTAWALEQARDAGDTRPVFRLMAFDRQFDAAHRTDAQRYWSGEQIHRWRGLKDAFLAGADGLPWVVAGLNPAQPAPGSFLSLHGLSTGLLGWLVGALALVWLGWALEGALGWRRMLILWPLAGLLATVVTALVLRNGQATLHSSQYVYGGHIMVSAAVGMYVGRFGLQRLRVLLPGRTLTTMPAWPAWVFLPVWLPIPWVAMAAGQHWIGALSGLLAGAAMVQLTRVPGVPDMRDQEDSGPDAQAEQLAQAWAAQGTMAFSDARRGFEAIVAAAPENFAAHLFSAHCGLYQNLKLQPKQPAFAAQAIQLLSLPLTAPGEQRQQHQIWREASALLGAELVLPVATQQQLICHFAAIDALSDAEALLARQTDGQSDEALDEDPDDSTDGMIKALRALAEGFTRRGNTSKARHYLSKALSFKN